MSYSRNEREQYRQEMLQNMRNERYKRISEQKNVKIDEAKLISDKEDEIERSLRKKFISDSFSFTFDKAIIERLLPPNTITNRRRIRYIIQYGIGEVNWLFRNIFLNPGINFSPNLSKKIKKQYYEAKNKIWNLRYKDENYFDKLSQIATEYLNKCFVIFFDFLFNKNKDRIFKTSDFAKDNILNAVFNASTIELSHNLKNELFESLELMYMNRFPDPEPETDDRENDDIDDEDGPFCEACQNAPCICSDPERTSTTWRF